MIWWILLIVFGVLSFVDFCFLMPSRYGAVKELWQQFRAEKKSLTIDAGFQKMQPSSIMQFIYLIFLILLIVVCANAFGIELILVIAVLAFALAWLVCSVINRSNKSVLKTMSNDDDEKSFMQRVKVKLTTSFVETCRSTFIILFIVVLVRSFLIEPYRIPSGSLKPTLAVGDFIVVNKYAYGLRLPVGHYEILPINEPKVGDIVVFRWPANPKIDFIKRCVGVPGDTVSYIDKTLYINGKKATQTDDGSSVDFDNVNGPSWPVIQKIEDLNGVKHKIYINPNVPNDNFKDLKIPQGYYLMMGDNRDNSGDSRVWGLVPEANIVGQATRVITSWNSSSNSIRWDRTGRKID